MTRLELGATDRRLPGWLRIAVLVAERGDERGLYRPGPGELRVVIGGPVAVTPAVVTRCIHQAVQRGLLAPGSSARLLVLDRSSDG